MKSSLGMSFGLHALVLLALTLSAGLTIGKEPRPVVYRVNLVEAAPFPEPAPEPVEESPVAVESPPAPPPTELPSTLPDLAPRQAKPRDAEVKVPEAAEPKAISVDEPEREKQPEAKAPPPTSSPAAAAPSENQEARPQGPSTQVESDSPIFTEYAYYRLAMRNKISAAWSPPRASADLVCVVRFQIVRSGAVVGARVEQSSGLPFFDHAALRAVLEASPLPPLPAEFPDDVVTVHFEFAYTP